MKIGGINFGRNIRQYSHDLSHDVNTTLPFGSVVPLMCQYMMKNSSIDVNARQLLRLAPMPSPTFGRIKAVNRAVFVPISEIYPAFEQLLAAQTVRGSYKVYVPTKVPHLHEKTLVSYLLSFCHWSLYKVTSYSSGTPINNPLTYVKYGSSDWTNFHKKAIDSCFGPLGLLDNTFAYPLYYALDARDNMPITLDSADYVYEGQIGSGPISASNPKFVFAFRLNSRGRRIHSILKHLGYSLSASDDTLVSVLPILAFYKAWFDSYAPKRDIAWTDTSVYSYIQDIFNRDISKILADTQGDSDTNNDDFFTKVFQELEFLDYTESLDYVSAHVEKLNRAPLGSQLAVPTSFTDGYSSSLVHDGLPTILESENLTQIGLDMLKRLSVFLTKDSLVGKKLTDWVRLHYGSAAAEDLFSESKDLGSWIVNANIDEVISSSDTVNGSNGEHLGSYAGKGLGFENGHVKFEARTFGYFFILTSIVPKAGYCQGNDPSLFGIDRFTLPNPDFDGLGYEVTPFSAIMDDGCISTRSVGTFGQMGFSSGLRRLSDGFGFIPRYSGYKIKKDVVSGDFSRRSTSSSLESFHLSRLIKDRHILTSDNNYVIAAYPTIPNASTAWRYPCKYPYLGNFNRIFYNSEPGEPANQDPLLPHWARSITDYPLDDNFILQTAFNVTLRNALKPIRDSYDTFADGVDDSSVNLDSE